MASSSSCVDTTPIMLEKNNPTILAKDVNPIPEETTTLYPNALSSTPSNSTLLQHTLRSSSISIQNLSEPTSNQCQSLPSTLLPSTSASSFVPVCSALSLSNTKTSEALLQTQKPYVSKNKKESKPKNTKNTTQEVDEVEKSFINLSSIVSEHFTEKKKMDEDDTFGCTVAYQLRKIEEPRKTEIKGKIMKVLYDY